MKKTITMFIFFCSLILTAQNQTEGVFKNTFHSEYSLKYMLYQPKDTKTKKPLILYLHGMGERGQDIQRVKIHGPFKFLKENDLDAFVLAPLCSETEFWDSDKLHNLIQEIQKKYSINENKIYVTGLSMGGWGTWNLITKYPQTFAAAIPICGMVDRMNFLQAEKIKNIPMKIFHGALDEVVPVDESIKILKKLRSINAPNVSLTIFDDAFHDSWTKVYQNPETYKWLLEQQKINN